MASKINNLIIHVIEAEEVYRRDRLGRWNKGQSTLKMALGHLRFWVKSLIRTKGRSAARAALSHVKYWNSKTRELEDVQWALWEELLEDGFAREP
ncbi:hypothetical protein ACHAQH_003958 [Verticillium albo-atrum]